MSTGLPYCSLFITSGDIKCGVPMRPLLNQTRKKKQIIKPVITPTMETVNRFRETIILSYNFNTVGGHKHCPGKTMSGPQSLFFFLFGGGGRRGCRRGVGL